MKKYFYTDGIEKYGPFSKEELCDQNISRTTKVWCYGMEKWTELSQVPELSQVLDSIPPELNSKYLKENVPISINSEIKSNQDKETNTIPRSTKKKKVTNIRKWIIAVTIIVLISIITYSLVNKNKYKEITTNAYDSNEDFNIYVQKFYRDLEFYGIYPKKPKVQIIKFSKLDQIDNMRHIHSISYGQNDDDKIEIYINPSSWQHFTKPMRYFLMYHELAHDVLNLDDLEKIPINEGKLMYPEISSYEKIDMDHFIDSFHALFEEQANK